MKNHWIEVYHQKGTKWWTAEFFGSASLKCRRIELEDESQLKYTNDLCVIFRNVSVQDKELLHFLNGVGKSMANTQALFHHNRGIFPVLIELECYDLGKLSYHFVRGGPLCNSMRFSFGFQVLNHTIH